MFWDPLPFTETWRRRCRAARCGSLSPFQRFPLLLSSKTKHKTEVEVNSWKHGLFCVPVAVERVGERQIRSPSPSVSDGHWLRRRRRYLLLYPALNSNRMQGGCPSRCHRRRSNLSFTDPSRCYWHTKKAVFPGVDQNMQRCKKLWHVKFLIILNRTWKGMDRSHYWINFLHYQLREIHLMQHLLPSFLMPSERPLEGSRVHCQFY